MIRKFKTKIFVLFIISLSINGESILIKNATIFDGIQSQSFVGNILIKDKKIIQVTSNEIKGDYVINANKKIVTPGLIAVDTELGIVEIGALSVTRDDSADFYKIGFSIYDAFNPNSTLIPWNRSNGITSSLTLPQNTSSPIGGLGSYFVLDGKMQIEGEADTVMIGRLGGSYDKSRSETLSIINDLLSFASSISTRQVNSEQEISELISSSSIATAMELHPRDVKALHRLINDNLPLIIKSHRASDLIKLAELKGKYNLNLIIMGAQESALVSEIIANNNIPLIINPIDNIPGSFDELAANITLSSRLEEEGIQIMFNASRDHNYHLIRQGAGVAVANGMSYGGAIKALTSIPASVFNIKDRGSIKVGNFADIIIWDNDPLEPSSMPEKVFINGESIDLTTRSSRLRDRYTKEVEKPVTYRN
tara:strand:+ start:2155 stop:3423 length:1269 start_codon:yes stop_codon:yes gene_type:complete